MQNYANSLKSRKLSRMEMNGSFIHYKREATSTHTHVCISFSSADYKDEKHYIINWSASMVLVNNCLQHWKTSCTKLIHLVLKRTFLLLMLENNIAGIWLTQLTSHMFSIETQCCNAWQQCQWLIAVNKSKA